MKTPLAWTCLIWALVAAGCSGTTPVEDPLVVALDQDWPASTREQAIEQAWSEMLAGQRDREEVRETLQRVVWKSSAPDDLRLRAAELLLSDTDETSIADTRSMFVYRLPTEPDLRVIRLVADRAVESGWRELAGPLVRSWLRELPGVEQGDRPELAAVDALYPDEPLIETVLDLFIDPSSSGIENPTLLERLRADAWETLSRLDTDGSVRARVLAERGPVGEGNETVELVRRCAEWFGAVPVTNAEVEWARGMFEPTPGARTWREQVRSAIDALRVEHRRLALRNIEPIRWASVHEPSILFMSRDDLLTTLAAEQASRRTHRRGEGTDYTYTESIDKQADLLTWADLVTIAVLDRAVRDPLVVEQLAEHLARDRADTTTEYGGLLTETQDARAEMILTIPRPIQRVNDRTFVAPPDMFTLGHRSLAHWHFHGQKPNNKPYAGPGEADLEYANRQGRACIVLTSIDQNTLNVDYYQRGEHTTGSDGVVVDLGEITVR